MGVSFLSMNTIRIHFRLPALLLVLFAFAEALLIFYGPIRLTRTPSLMVAPFPYTPSNLSEDQSRELTAAIEGAFASTGNSSVKPQYLVQEYLAPSERSLTEITNQEDALSLAKELGVLRLAYPYLSRYSGTWTLHLTLLETTDGEQIAAKSFQADSPESLMDELAGLAFTETFNLEVPGFTTFDYTFFLFLALELLLALLIMFRPSRLFNQTVIITGGTLFLFAWFFARNANMDYVQRFVAQGGALKIASSTARQQAEVALRFLPLLLVNFFLYFSGGPAAELLRNSAARRAIRSNSSGLRPSGISTSIPAAAVGLLLNPPVLAAGIVSGVLYALSFPSLLRLRGIPLLGFFALVPLFLALRRQGLEKRGEAAAGIMAFAAVQVVLINFWHSTYSYVSLPFTVLLSLAQWLIFLPLFVFLLRRKSPAWIILAPSVMVAFDWFRGMGFLAYPWGMLGTVVYSWPVFIQIASVTGIWGLTWLMTGVNASLAHLLSGSSHRRQAVNLLAVSLLLPLAFGAFRLLVSESPVPDKRILLVQHNMDPRKYDYAESLDVLTEITEMGLSVSAEAGKQVDLVAWPETAFVPDIRYWMREGNAGRPRRKLAEKLFASVDRWQVPLLTGSSDHTRLPGEKDRDYPSISYNSTYLIRPSVPAGSAIGDDAGNKEEAPESRIVSIYHKMKLVPFTEYFPFKKELPEVYAQLDKFDVSDWTPGTEYTLHNLDGTQFATPICFEDIMPDHVRRFASAGAELIVNVSNDYWSLSPVEGMQHGVNGMFRAVENGIPAVRATASGLTMSIDPYGRILKQAPFFRPFGVLADLPPALPGKTLYTRFGDWLPKLSFLLLPGIPVFEIVRRRMRRTDRDGEDRKDRKDREEGKESKERGESSGSEK